jgi:chromosomal replication initiation ATPase DnaA
MEQLAIKLTKRELFEHYMSVRSRMNRAVENTNKILENAAIPEAPQPLEEDKLVLPYASANKIKMICKYVGAIYGFTVNDIMSARRTLKLVEARHIACYVSRHATRYSYPQIGRAINRDHSSVIHGVCQIEERIKQGGSFALGVQDIVERFKRDD